MLIRRGRTNVYLGLSLLVETILSAGAVGIINVGYNGTRSGSYQHSHNVQGPDIAAIEEIPNFEMVTEEDRVNPYLNFSLILQELLSNYDKRLRPNFGSGPVNVVITMHVTSISGVSETEMAFTVDFYLRQQWTDERLSFSRDSASRDITVGIELLSQIWKPDTFFPNEKQSSFHSATVHNSFLRISPTGDIYSSQRITVTAACPMMLQDFPFDKQQCLLALESYGYGVEDIKYDWKPGVKPFEIANDTWLPQFILRNVTVDKKIITLSSGSYSRLYIYFPLKRDIGFYMMQVYLPAIVVVFISLLAFWFPDYLLGYRVGICFTAVLTMTVLMTTTSSNLPKISYVKAIDIYFMVSFTIIFITLIESYLVAFMTPEGGHDATKNMVKKTKECNANKNKPQNYCGTVDPYEEDYESLYDDLLLEAKIKNTHNNGKNYNENIKPVNNEPINAANAKGVGDIHELKPRTFFKQQSSFTGRFQRNIDLLRNFGFLQKNCHPLDRYSRFIFPTMFILFNAVYWAVYLPKAITMQQNY